MRIKNTLAAAVLAGSVALTGGTAIANDGQDNDEVTVNDDLEVSCEDYELEGIGTVTDCVVTEDGQETQFLLVPEPGE